MDRTLSRKVFFIGAGAFALLCVLGLVVFFAEDPATYFSLAETKKMTVEKTVPKKPFYISGFIERGSLQEKGDNHYFRITDLNNSLETHYWGLPPTPYQEAQAVVAYGLPGADGVFEAQRLFTKQNKRLLKGKPFAALLESEEQ